MNNKYKDLTAEECAERYIRKTVRYHLFYALFLGLIIVIYSKGKSYILPLLYGDYEIVEIYCGIYDAWYIIFLIEIMLCSAIAICIRAVQVSFFMAICTNLCDPKKYIEAEKIVCDKLFFGHRSAANKIRVANAYMMMKDYENAGKIYMELIPEDLSRFGNRDILEGLACYFINIEDMDNARKYLTRLEEMRASRKKVSKVLDTAIDNVKGSIAIYEKKYDEAKEYINNCLTRLLLSNCSKINCHYRLAEIAYECGDYAEAIYRYRAVIDGGEKLYYADEAKKKLEELQKKIIKD